MYMIMSFEGRFDETNVGKLGTEGKIEHSIRYVEGEVTVEHNCEMAAFIEKVQHLMVGSEGSYRNAEINVPDQKVFSLCFLFEVDEKGEKVLAQKFNKISTKFHNMARSANCRLDPIKKDDFQKRFGRSVEQVFEHGLTISSCEGF